MLSANGLSGLFSWPFLNAIELQSLTAPPLLYLLGSLGRPEGALLLLLLGPAPVKVLHDDADEHVQHEEADEEQERDEVDQAPLVEVLPGLAMIRLSSFGGLA